MNNIARFIFVLLLLSTSNSYAADNTLYMGAPPREGSEAKSRAYYEPIARALSKVLGLPVEFKFRENFFKYGTEMRHDGYDIIFDGPHFAAWRMSQLDHEPIVRLPGNLKFVVVARKDNTKVTDKDSLVAKKICGPAVPNLATLSAMSAYSESLIRQPIFESIKGGMGGSYKAFKKGRCDAVALRDGFFFKKIKKDERKELRVVFDTKPQPNQTITTSRRLSSTQNKLLIDFLTSDDGAKAAEKLLKRFSKNKTHFIKADRKDYPGLDKSLIKYAFGWKPK